MDRYNSLRTPDSMAADIYNFLDSLLAAVRISETLAMEAQQSEQNDLPGDILPGGYSHEIFIFLSEKEKLEYNCSVCYSVIKDVHQCPNGHKFCYSCIYVWSKCNRAGADNCPACRCDGLYARNDQLNEKIGNKRVKCQNDDCNWRGFLKHYNEHEHRHYKFKELSRSIEFPVYYSKETGLKSSTMNSLELLDEIDYIDDTFNKEKVDSNSCSTDKNNVSMEGSSSSDNIEMDVNVLRTTIDNYSTSENILTNDSHGINISTNLSNSVRTSRSSELDYRTGRSGDDFDLNVPFQTLNSENIEFADSDEWSSVPREGNNSLLPLSTINDRSNNTFNNFQTMEYRRLSPTYSSRRRNLGFMADDGESLAMLLILLTSDIENGSSSNSNNTYTEISTRRSISNGTASSSLTNENNMTQNYRNDNNSRLRDIRNLNVRLTEVESRLDSLFDSSREDDGMEDFVSNIHSLFTENSEDE